MTETRNASPDTLGNPAFAQVDFETAELEMNGSIYDGFNAAIMVAGQPRTVALCREYSDAVQFMATLARAKSATAMIIRLHAEGILSEGQAVAATGLHRVDVRRRVDDLSDRPVGMSAANESLKTPINDSGEGEPVPDGVYLRQEGDRLMWVQDGNVSFWQPADAAPSPKGKTDGEADINWKAEWEAACGERIKDREASQAVINERDAWIVELIRERDSAIATLSNPAQAPEPVRAALERLIAPHVDDDGIIDPDTASSIVGRGINDASLKLKGSFMAALENGRKALNPAQALPDDG